MDPTQPLVGVVVPAQNRGDLLRECLESVAAQTYLHWECVIADDGSDDNVPEVAAEFASRDARFRHLRLPRGGAQRARNAGWEAVGGELLVFHDSDDLFAPRKLEASVDAFRADRSLDMIVGQTEVFEQSPGDLGFLWNTLEPADFLRRFLRRDVVWPCQGAVWRREFLQGVGPWRVELTSNQDFDQNLRGLLAGARVKTLDEVLVHVRLAGPSVSRGESLERKRQRLRDMEAVYANAQSVLASGDVMEDLEPGWTFYTPYSSLHTDSQGVGVINRLRGYKTELASQGLWLAREAAALGDPLALEVAARLRALDPLRSRIARLEARWILATGRCGQALGRLNVRLGLELPQVAWMRRWPVGHAGNLGEESGRPPNPSPSPSG